MKATERYKMASNPLNDFLDEMCETGEDKSCLPRQVYEIYSSWCRKNGVRQMPMRSFSGRILDYVDADTGARVTIGVNDRTGKPVIRGLGLAEDSFGF